ncbi:Polycystic kidney disease 1 like 1 [Dissostichus eleginoides]|uniref:Polycystic kidney disease 1 like 1 n=1 Tax=Dissostichus eleginoides TaxID=100907 RepID=A0AAD9BPG7_DISEL|nr:Polycystic kidney disease 1 like 1 [Dissostichus eleginoides]
MVLKGEDGFSQTRELHVPGCTLFRRNSQDTFIIRRSPQCSLGPVWGAHIWHDNSEPSPSWNIKHLDVSEVSRGQLKGRAWLFVAQCWLFKMPSLKLSDYLADYHIWISLYSCPCPNAFTHTQRLCVSLLLLLGYARVSTLIISQMDDQLPFQFGCVEATAVSVRTGYIVSSRQYIVSSRQYIVSSWQYIVSSRQYIVSSRQYIVSSRQYIGAPSLLERSAAVGAGHLEEEIPGPRSSISVPYDSEFGTRDGGQEPKSVDGGSSDVRLKGGGFRSHWGLYLAWTLCLLMSLCCLVLSAVQGMRFSSSKVLLWMHSLLCSLVFCIFIIQPAVGNK